MAAFLYLGAGLGMLIYSVVPGTAGKSASAESLTRKELPYTVAMVILDIATPIFLMFGIKASNAANVSLINNFEIVATSIIALFVFKEMISKRLWIAIALAVMILSTYFMVKDTIALQHTHAHQHTHTHEHRHGETVHSHSHAHTHTHLHVHGEDSNDHKHTHNDLAHEHLHAHP